MLPSFAAEMTGPRQLFRRAAAAGSREMWQRDICEPPGIRGVSPILFYQRGWIRTLLKKMTEFHSQCCRDQAATVADAASPNFHEELSANTNQSLT